MHRAGRLILLLGFGLLFLGACRRAEDGRVQLRVFAASSLTNLMSAVEAEYERIEPAVDLRFHFAGSNELAEQLLAGADADLFLPASPAELERLQEAELLRGEAHVSLFSNHLVWVHGIDGSSRGGERFALADPEAVPAGRYARTWLEELGEWERIEPRIAPAPSVRAALALLTSGAAREGVVYASDVLLAPQLAVFRVQEVTESPTILYGGAVLHGGDSLAEDCLRWLRDDPGAQEIAQQHGFVPAPERP